MNILEHDCEEKFYHEYNSSKLSRGGRSNEEDTTSTSTASSSSVSSSVLSSFNGLYSSPEKERHPQYQDETLAGNIDNSGNSKGGSEIKAEPPSPRMDSGISCSDSCNSGITNSILVEDVSKITKNETDGSSSSAVFTCGNCGKASIKNGEFETIKLGDIFTQITQFPSSSEGTHEGPRLCAQCLNSSQGQTSGSSTTHHNNIQYSSSSVINSSNTNSCSNNNNSNNKNNCTVVVTSTSIVSPTTNHITTNCSTSSSGGGDGKSGNTVPSENHHVESSGQFLQGVSTIIMQNSNNLPVDQPHQLHQFQQSQLQSPPPNQTTEMHHDLQQQHFYQQGHLIQQVKMEPDTMVHSQQFKLESDSMPHSQPIKLESDSMDHSQHQSLHHLDNFMLIHDSAMYPDNNDSLQQQQQHLHQQQTMVSFDDHSMHQLQQRQQVICDNQHQSAIQHITVVTPGSDIKYTIPTAIMQMQGKDQGGVDQGQGQQQLIQFNSGQNQLVSLPQHSNGSSGGGLMGNDPVSNASSASGTPGVFQFLDLTTLSESKDSLVTLITTSVVTHTTSTTSSITTTPSPTILTTNSKSSAKPRSNKKDDSGANAASGSSGANSKKANNSSNAQKQKPDSPKIPCDLCKKKFKNPKMAMNHYRRVHEKEPRFICEICGAVFSYRDSLDCHQVSHRPQEKTHDCGKCGMKFSTKANLRSHTRIHTENPKKFPCEFCPSGFSKRVNLRYHIKRKHPEEAEKMNNNNNSKDNLPGSLAGLTGVPPVHGAFPSSTSSTTSPGDGSNVGVGAETGDSSKDNKSQGSFKCEHCDRAFLFKNNLKAHLRTHTRDKKYTCELCGKSFIYKESLKNHMLLHSNELPYLCDICGKKFRDRSNRRKHVKNVHKYLFVNGDINNPLKPGATPGTTGQASSSGGAVASVTQPGEPPTKKRKNSKKTTDPLQTESIGGEPGTQDGGNKARTIIKSPAAPRGKKAKNASTATAGSATQPKPASATNTKSVIVSASTTASVGVDRKIIMSPSPKTPKTASSSSVPSPNSLDYVPSHSLPVTVHVPLAGSSQFSHGGRNIIVKASPSASNVVPPNHHQSPPALSPEMYHHQQQQQQQHGRGPASMQQNVIVYPKPKVIPDHAQQYPSSSSSVISQTMQQAQHQYYVNPDQHHHPQQPPQGYSYHHHLASHNQQPSPVQSSLLPPSHLSSPNPSAFEYVLGSTNLSSQSQDNRGNDPSGGGGPTQTHHPYGAGPGGSLAPEQQQPMEIQIKSEYSHHFYSQDPNSIPYEQQHYHHWTSAPPVMDHGGGHPPSSSSPYQQLVAPPVGSNGSSSGLVNEGAHPQHPPNSLAQSYDSGGMNPTSNALSPEGAVYAHGAAAQGHEVLDPPGNGGNFFYKDFDFSYL